MCRDGSHTRCLGRQVTRAKKKCVLLCSAAVLNPTLAACETPERQAGFELLRSINAYCKARKNGSRRLDLNLGSEPLLSSQLSAASQPVSEPEQRSQGLGSCIESAQVEDDDEEEMEEDNGDGHASKRPRDVGDDELDKRARLEGDPADAGTEAMDIANAETQVSNPSQWSTPANTPVGSQVGGAGGDVDDEMEVSQPVLPVLVGIALTADDEQLLSQVGIGRGLGELRVPLQRVLPAPLETLPYEDWPGLSSLPACVRRWREQGYTVQAAPVHSAASVDWYTQDMHDKVARLIAQI